MRVFLPVILLLFAVLTAALFAYGTEPAWASHGQRGLELILWTHRFQSPLIVLSLLLCIAMGVLVISTKRRIIWLIGLLPVLALFYHKYTDGPAVGLFCLQDPPFVTAEEAREINADERVVGIVVNSNAYAFATSALHRSPVIVATILDRRIVLLWSQYANRALVFSTARDFRADDLQVVSCPNNALLVYNSRLGQFINGVTGKTVSGAIPTGFHDQMAVVKTTWRAWVLAHPQTRVLVGSDSGAFTQPSPPKYSMPGTDASADASRSICMVASTQPIAVPSESVTSQLLNLSCGSTSVLLTKVQGEVHAFNRELPGDLVPRFAPGTDSKHRSAVWVDSDTNSAWNVDGVEVDGPKETHGFILSQLPVEDELYLNVMKFWYPQLHLVTDQEIAKATVVKSSQPVTLPQKSSGRHRKNQPKG